MPMLRLLPLFASLLIAAPAAAQLEPATLTGTVYHLTSGDSLPAAMVQLFRGDEVVRATAADASGRYTLTGVPPGHYTLEATFIGYSRAQRDVTVRAGEQAGIDLLLGFRATEEDFEYGRREAREDVARGMLVIREPGWSPPITTGDPEDCFGKEHEIRAELEKTLYGIERVEAMAGHDELPVEVLEARLEGYNEVVEAHLARTRGTAWKERLMMAVGAELYRRFPACRIRY